MDARELVLAWYNMVSRVSSSAYGIGRISEPRGGTRKGYVIQLPGGPGRGGQGPRDDGVTLRGTAPKYSNRVGPECHRATREEVELDVLELHPL